MQVSLNQQATSPGSKVLTLREHRYLNVKMIQRMDKVRRPYEHYQWIALNEHLTANPETSTSPTPRQQDRAVVMKKRGDILSFPGRVLDFKSLPIGTLLQRGQTVKFKGERWIIHDLPHCFDDGVVLLSEDGQRRWCDLCEKEIGLTESDSFGMLGD